ncbi:MAG: efflux RND transporter permease subunit [Ruminococcus sp.]|nr:efflux RND transporter permease subunit [Ruminococcus sp.]
MLSKFSVKKPMTVFVCVVIVIVLGIVSFMKMTPDLLPNMDLPYAMIMTTYVGQTPETVESTVTKPLEQSIATIDGVKAITSNSSENYSMLMIEFEDGTDMNTATVDLRSALDTISDRWPDGVGSPYLLKINPNMLPIGMAAVDYEGMNQSEISEYVENTLLNQLEGIDGVASISNKGILTEKENVIISQEKVNKLNKKISAALDSQFADAEDQLQNAKDELNNNINLAEEGSATITSTMEDLTEQQAEVAKQLSEAQKQADNGMVQILSAKMQLLDQKMSLETQKSSLEKSYQDLIMLKKTYEELTEQQDTLNKSISQLSEIQEMYNQLKDAMSMVEEGSEEYQWYQGQIAELEKSLSEYNIKLSELDSHISDLENALETVNSSLAKIESTLMEMQISYDSIDATLNTMSEGIAQLDMGNAQISETINGLDEQSVSVNDALATILQQQSGTDFQMSSAVTNLTSKQTELSSTLTQLESAKKEVQTQIDKLSDTKSDAKDKADMSNMVTVETISGILTAQNFSMPAGYVKDDLNNQYMIRVGDKIANEDEMRHLVLFDTGIDGIGVVKLDDVADVFIADNASETYAKINGQDGIVLSFSKQSDVATSTVCENINITFEKLSEENEGLHFTNLYNQGDYISIIVNSVLQNLLMGAVLAIIILFLFLRDIKPTVIVGFSIPISVVFAIVLMYFSGISLNMISLSGLAIGVGMLVDNSVVVIENIYRLRGLGYSPIRAAVNGAGQVAGAIAASTLTTICVFTPIVFVEGITRQLFVDMALTIAYSLLASLIVALTLVPAMSQGMLKKIREPKHKNKNGSKILNAYEKSLRTILKHKVVTIIVVIALLFGSVFGALAKGFSFMPEMSSTEIEIDVTLDKNATFEETVDVANQVNEVLNKYEEFDTVGVMVGSTSSLMGMSIGGASNDAGSVMAYCVLNEKYTKDGKDITKRLESDLENVDGEVTVGGGSSSSMSMMLGEQSIQINLNGNDLENLQSTAEDMAKQLESVEGIATVDNGVGATSPEIKVTVNKQKAIEKGLTVAQVFQQIASAVSTETTSTTLTNDNGDSIDVVIIKDESSKVLYDKVGEIKISYTNKEGETKKISLSSIADISNSETMNVISRSDQKRYLIITGILKDGYILTNVANEVKELFDNYELPKDCSIEYSGSDETTMEAVGQLMLMMLLGVILIYLIMVAQFQSLKSPFIIMFTIPLAFTGGFLALIITGFDVSVIALIGFIMLCGIIVNNGIVLVDYINQLRIAGTTRIEAIVEAGKTRMRPILITALTTILGLSVMALGIGTGAEMMQPLAIVCIGGLVYATFMTLFIIPVIYDIFNKKEPRKVSEYDLEAIDE